MRISIGVCRTSCQDSCRGRPVEKEEVSYKGKHRCHRGGDCRATRVILSYIVFVIVFHSVIPASGDSAATAREAKYLIEESEGGPV